MAKIVFVVQYVPFLLIYLFIYVSLNLYFNLEFPLNNPLLPQILYYAGLGYDFKFSGGKQTGCRWKKVFNQNQMVAVQE